MHYEAWQRQAEELEAKKPAPREGTCVVCAGKITEEFYLQSQYRDPMLRPIGGPPEPAWWASHGLYCTVCGIKYQHLPKELPDHGDDERRAARGK